MLPGMKNSNLFLPLMVVAMLLLSVGCGNSKPLAIRSIEHPTVVVEPHFKEAWYRMDRDRTLFFVLKRNTIDPDTQQTVYQVLLIRAFWQPVGGRTPMDPAALNATFRYLVMSPKAVGMYEGAGFVRLSQKAGAKDLDARIVDGDLRLTEASADFHDNFGRAIFRGALSAKLSDVKAFDETAQAHRDFFSRSLELSKVAATQTAN